MYLLECQPPPAIAHSKEAIGRLCEEVGACGDRIFFASGVAWTHAGRRFGIVTQDSRAVRPRAITPHFFSRSNDSAVA